MRVQVLEVQDGAPKRVRFDFAQPLGEMRVYAWQGREPEPLPLPLPKIGERVQLKAAATM